MQSDETAIRDLVARWHAATAADDVDTVLDLMDEDAVFLVAGRAPMRGRAAFAASLRGLLATHAIRSTSDIQEVEISGDLAYCWSVLDVRIAAKDGGGSASTRSGSALSILRKQPDGQWRVVRDANLLTAAS